MFCPNFTAQFYFMQDLTLVTKFLKSLSNNNNKPWFDAHRPQYETARAEFLEFVGEILKGLEQFDEKFTFLQPKNCVFRINRDVRFSKNKTPYKNNMSAYFNGDGKKSDTAGYYFHLQPGNSFVAMGIWQPEKENLYKIRQEIDYNLKDFKKILSNATFKKNLNKGLDESEKLIRPPKGFEEDNPAIDFIKLKSFVVRASITNKELTEEKFAARLLSIFKAGKPFVDFLNTALH